MQLHFPDDAQRMSLDASHVSGCFSPKLIYFTNEIHVYHVAVPGLAGECRCCSVLKMVPDIDKMFLFLRFFFSFRNWLHK